LARILLFVNDRLLLVLVGNLDSARAPLFVMTAIAGNPSVCCHLCIAFQGAVLMVRFYEGAVAQDNKAAG
jgi:hypothetical protein